MMMQSKKNLSSTLSSKVNPVHGVKIGKKKQLKVTKGKQKNLLQPTPAANTIQHPLTKEKANLKEITNKKINAVNDYDSKNNSLPDVQLKAKKKKKFVKTSSTLKQVRNPLLKCF